MGITIHYEFKFKGTPEQALEKLKKVRNTALDLPFEKVKEIWELDYSKGFNDDTENKRAVGDDTESYRWAKIQYEQRGKWKNNALISDPNTKLYKGWVFTAWSGAGCEPTNIGLVSYDNMNWSGGAFTKTQYAEQFVRCHLLIVSILDVCKMIGILKSVSDEGEYYETRNLSVLGGNINQSTEFIQAIAGKLKSAVGESVHIESEIEKSKNYVKISKTKKTEKSRL